MSHGIVDVFAFQEALLIEAAFGVALLTMIWIGFRRWLQHKERMGTLVAEQTAEGAAQYRAQMECVEERLKAIEQIVSGGGVSSATRIEETRTSPAAEPLSHPKQPYATP